MIIDNLNKRPEATVPNDITDPPRFAQPIETTKDAFLTELINFFNRSKISNSRLEEVPTIRKFDISLKKSESSHETAVKIIRKMPDINENLPLIAILGATGRNLSMGFGGQFVASVAPKTSVESSSQEPFNLVDGDRTLIFRTITPQKVERITTIILRASSFSDITQATAKEIAKEINFQTLFAKASVGSNNTVVISYGGVSDGGSVTGDIIMGDDTGNAGTAAANIGFIPGQEAKYVNTIPFNRYQQATFIDIGIEIVCENDNVRTELADLVWSFFTFYMDSRDYMFLGRSIFDPDIPNETYQVIIKPDPSMSGENEVPRPNGDETDKLYVNRINIPVLTVQYIDRAVVKSNNDPLYLDSDGISFDSDMPQKN